MYMYYLAVHESMRWNISIITIFQLQDNIEEDEDLNENASPFLNTPASEAASHAANILKELGYENIAIYPGGKYHNIISNMVLQE